MNVIQDSACNKQLTTSQDKWLSSGTDQPHMVPRMFSVLNWQKKNVGTYIPEKKGKAFAVAPNEEISWNKKKSNATVGP